MQNASQESVKVTQDESTSIWDNLGDTHTINKNMHDYTFFSFGFTRLGGDTFFCLDTAYNLTEVPAPHWEK